MDEVSQNLYESNMMRENARQTVRNYNLFGESADLPDVVHCETIAFRSRLHNWELAPHRHARLHQILLIEAGGGSVDVDGDRRDFGPAACINIPVGVVHGFSFFPGTQGWVVTIATEILDQTLQDSEGLRGYLARPGLLTDCIALKPTVELLFAEFAAKDFARAQVLRALCGLLMGFVARELANADRREGREQHLSLHRRFQDLADRHFTDHWPVTRYADALAVTPGHLSRVCRQATGVSASGVINERVIREARRLLTYTNLTIAEIAYELGYTDPAYFTRVFTRTTGVAPRRFRKELGERTEDIL
jgi:AraC family transcriptional activator of pobA